MILFFRLIAKISSNDIKIMCRFSVSRQNILANAGTEQSKEHNEIYSYISGGHLVYVVVRVAHSRT